LYAAGEFRMAFGNEQAGLRLISRAEAIRSAKANAKPVENCGVQPKSEAQPKKVEVCTRDRKSAPPVKVAIPMPGGEAMTMPPEAPAPPEVRMVAAYNFSPNVMASTLPVMSYTRTQHANHIKVEVLRKVQKIKLDAECKQAEAFAAAMRTQTVDTAAIMRSVRSELKKRNMPEGAVMMLQPPVVATE
jgi:hypothetical protein